MEPVSLARIRNTAFGIELPEPAARQLAAMAVELRVARGTVLFREGDAHDGFYLIETGHVGLEMCLAGRGCTRLLTVGPGEFLAWSSLVGDARMTTTAIAQDDVELLQVSGSELAAACDADHELGYAVMRRLATALSRRLLATRLQLLDLFIADAPPSRGGQA